VAETDRALAGEERELGIPRRGGARPLELGQRRLAAALESQAPRRVGIGCADLRARRRRREDREGRREDREGEGEDAGQGGALRGAG
jgi:hypothetical protein